MMFLQPLTWQTLANRNEPRATAARSAPVQWALVYLIFVRTTMPNIKQINAVTSPLSTGIPLIAPVVFFSLACMNKMKQSRGININAVITALRATQNQDNSRRLASRKKKRKSSLHLLLHSSRMADMLQLVTLAWKVYRRICVAVVHSSCAPEQAVD